MVSCDVGFAKSAGYYANYLNVSLAIGNKQRDAHDENARVLHIIGEVKDKNAVIVDDFTLSCGTLIDTARQLKAQGVLDIYAFVSHALLSDKGIAALEDSPITQLVITDSVYNPAAQMSKKVKTVSVAGMFAQAIQIIHDKSSLSNMFT